jgi:hypothetical protein
VIQTSNIDNDVAHNNKDNTDTRPRQHKDNNRRSAEGKIHMKIGYKEKDRAEKAENSVAMSIKADVKEKK